MSDCRFALETDRGRRRWWCACGRRGYWLGARSDVHRAWRQHQRLSSPDLGLTVITRNSA
jgi:hypothetical protein